MPSPNVVNKGATKNTAERKSSQLEKGLARKRSQDFASKILGWNAGGAGIAQEQDDVFGIEEEKPESVKAASDVEVIADAPSEGQVVEQPVPNEAEPEKGSPDTPKIPASGPEKTSTKLILSNHTSREVDLQRKAWVRRKSKVTPEHAADVKQVTTPKKRIVSDGHWRRDRTPKTDSATPEKEKDKDSNPKPVTIRRSVVNVGLKVPPSVQDFVEEQEVSPRVRPLRRTKSRSGEGENTPDYQDSGVKIYIKRRPRSATVNERKDGRTSESSLTADTTTSIGQPTSASTDITVPDLPRPTTAPKESTRRKSLSTEDEQRRISRRKSKNVGNDDVERPHSPPRHTTLPSSSPPKVFGSRIEGWLAQTDHPFDRDPSLTPEPLDCSRKKLRKVEEESRDENEAPKPGQRTRRKTPGIESVYVSRSDKAMDISPTLKTPTLKRAGARRHTHSPVKDRLLRETGLVLDEEQIRRVSDDTLRRRVSRQTSSSSFPYHTNRLSAIASAETLSSRYQGAASDTSEHPTVIPQGSVLSRASDGDEPRRQNSGLRRRMTKHSDLMSVLSMSREDNPGIKSARSIRTRRAPVATATIADIMNEVTTDELKYQRELRTLVDGVIPVLLTYVLQKTDASGTKRLFSGSSPVGQEVTRPIVEMGVALERLKATHKRIPLHDASQLLRWAGNASRHYSDYLKAWRLGFKDVVVTLAPLEENEKATSAGAEGERVDVAYLLKRPLVRLKYLHRTFKGIEDVQPSEAAKAMVTRYHELVQEARQRNNDERARLEDEAAARIDPTRTRDPRSLVSLAGVRIDPTRSVRARDYFDLDLTHSSGQQLLCKVEVILRDDAPDRGTSGDVLFCEVSIAGKWLLFPPIPSTAVSARPGDQKDEIVIMIRGMLAGGREWREVMSLRSTDSFTIKEWLEMLSSTPQPPRLCKTSSFNDLRGPYMSGGLDNMSAYRPPSPSEIDIPIGEKAESSAQQWDGSEVNSGIGDITINTLGQGKDKHHRGDIPSPTIEDAYERARARADRIAEQEHYYQGKNSSTSRRERYHERSRSNFVATKSGSPDKTNGLTESKKAYKVWLPSSDRASDDSDSADEEDRPPPSRPGMHRRTSSVPSMDMPTIQKLRKPTVQGQPVTPNKHTKMDQQTPISDPVKLRKEEPLSLLEDSQKADSQMKGTRPKSLSPSSPIALPSFTPAFLKRNRRPSSPLKHEYEPSTASESLSSDSSDFDEADSVTSDSTADDDPAVSTIGELKDFRNLTRLRPRSEPAPPQSPASVDTDTVGPSDSASQAPYRQVPPTGPPAKTVACIMAWTDRGTWESLHPEDCSIVVTPGLIEAFDLAQAASAMAASDLGDAITPSQRGVKPLIALELTPLVPLRRGTALDISIRSPPTENSLLRTSNNIMFRSRSPEECEKLYGLINRARIDNPTYIALQNARGPVPTSNWGEVMDRRNSTRTSGHSWLRLGSRRSSTYRSNASRTQSKAATESSVGTMTSAFSALRRFSGGNKLFNIAKSTLTSREGTRSSYSDSLSSGAATPMPIDPKMGTPLGVTNSKIRLYIRESVSKWRDLGPARLTVMLPPRPDASVPAPPKTSGLDKRILICGKSRGEILLDATLNEQCFERIARTGIAVSVVEEARGPNGEAVIGATGGVSSASSKVYMIQMKSERDAAYTFGLVGKLRY